MKLWIIGLIVFSLGCNILSAESTKSEIIQKLNNYFECDLDINDSTLIVNQISKNKWELLITSSTLRRILMQYLITFESNEDKLAKDYKIIIDHTNDSPIYYIGSSYTQQLIQIYNWKYLLPDGPPTYVKMSANMLHAINTAYNDFIACMDNPDFKEILLSDNYRIQHFKIIKYDIRDDRYKIEFRIPNYLDGGVRYTLDQNFQIIRRTLGRVSREREPNIFEIINDSE